MSRQTGQLLRSLGLAILATTFVAPLAAQNPPSHAPLPEAVVTNTELPGLKLRLKSVSENRPSRAGSPSARTSLTMELLGDGIAAPAVVRSLAVTQAIDEQGHPVPPSAIPGSNAMSAVFALSNSQTETAPNPEILATASVAMLPRTITSLKVVEGTMEIFRPTVANGGLIRIPNIKVHHGRVEHPEFAKRGIAFVYVASPEDYDEAQRLQSQVGPGGLSSRLGSNPDGKNSFGYFFRDPTGTVAGAQLQDSRGTPLSTRDNGGVSNQNSAFMNFIVPAGIPDDAQLVIFLAVPEAIKRASFRFENVPLP